MYPIEGGILYRRTVNAVEMVIRRGRVVTPTGVLETDVAVSAGTIAAIGPDAGASVPGAREVDARGCYVLPGGVDPHCHLMSGLGPSSRAAALGGTTTALSFSLPEDGEDTLSAFRRARALVTSGVSAIDVGLHAMCYQPNVLTAADLEQLAELGADAVKVFLAYPELGIMATGDGLHRVMTAAARLGLPVQVHCEDGELIEALVEDASSLRLTGARTFAEVRPPVLEEVAVRRALAIAELTGSRLYVTHLSSADAIGHIRRARAAGQQGISAEACLHHLLLSVEEYAGPAADQLLVAPPLREEEHVEAVGAALRDGTLDTVGSDHSQQRTVVDERICPCGDAQYGIAGIGARMPLLLSWGMENGIPIERLAHVLSTGPADAFGYGPRKGRIAVGSDADLVVWDPARHWTVEADSFRDGTGTSPYLNRKVQGWIRFVSLRGRVLVDEGRLNTSEEPGRLLAPARNRGRRDE
jgi:dihydropyrimidinase